VKALDTNALVRFFVRDDEKQAQAVKKMLVEEKSKGNLLFISIPVILELMWVLSSFYEYSREEIITALENLLLLSVFQVEAHDRISALCEMAAKSSEDLADLLIGLTAYNNDCTTTLTFDKKAARSSLFTLIK
jgi:predicted nucleic-acid-binding protein